MRSSSEALHPEKMISSGVECVTNEDFLSDLDRAFDQIQIVSRENTRKKIAKLKTKKNLAQMQTTFLAVARIHLCPVLRYLKAIHRGVASKDLCEIVYYVIGPIIGKTRKAGLVEETKALVSFQRNLKTIVQGSSKKIVNDQKIKLAQSFDPVAKMFCLDFRGHSAAVVNLLGFYKAMKKNKSFSEEDTRKFFAIGIPSMTMLRKSSVKDLSSLSGIHPEKIALLRQQARKFSTLELL